jgi:hypothetical protein
MSKKSLFLLALSCVLLIMPDTYAMKMGAGAKLGLNMGSLYGDNIDNIENYADGSLKTGFVGYGVFSVDFIDFFGAEIEAGFTSKGKKWDYSDSSISLKFDYQFNYLEIPILFKGMIPLGIAKPMLYAGPTLGFLLSSKEKVKEDYSGQSIDTTITIPDSTTNSIEFGLAFGGGCSFDVGPGSLVLELRYTLGLTNIPKATDSEKADADYNESDYNMKSGTLAILVGYVFKF